MQQEHRRRTAAWPLELVGYDAVMVGPQVVPAGALHEEPPCLVVPLLALADAGGVGCPLEQGECCPAR